MRVLLPFMMLFFVLATKAQVNLQSGAAIQNFPLVEYTDEKAGLSLNVGISYNSGNGLLVNDIASDVGTGFNLDGGGIIMRLQGGTQPDDQKEFFTGDARGPNSVKNYGPGYMYNPHIGKGCNTGGNYYPVFRENGIQRVYKDHNEVTADLEQDRFVFRFGSRVGAFVISKNLGNDVWKVTTLGDSRLKIGFSAEDMTAQGIRTRISKFVIVTEEGIRYTFAQKSLTRICRYKLSGINNAGQLYPVGGEPADGGNEMNRYYGYPLADDERPYVVNSWYLSEIENINTGSKILFDYKSNNHDIITSKHVSHLRDLNKTCGYSAINKKNQCGRNWYQVLSNPVTAELFSWDLNQLSRLAAGPTNITYIRSVIQLNRLTQISFPNGGRINIEYQSKERYDLPGAYAISSIEYRQDDELVRGYKLVHGYMFHNATRPYNTELSSKEAKYARLALLSITKTGNATDDATEPPFKFDYYTGATHTPDDIVPARNFLSQDHWGYYNGDNAALPLNEDHDLFAYENPYFKSVLAKHKNPKNGYAKNGLLRAVTYPAGGKLEYEYQQNKPGTNILPSQYPQFGGGVSVSKTTLYDANDMGKNIISEYSYTKPNGSSSRWGDEKPVYHSLNVTEYNETWLNKLFKHAGVIYPEMAGSSVNAWKVIASIAMNMVVSYGISALMAALIPAEAIPVVNIIVTAIMVTKMVFDATKTYEFHRFVLSNQNAIQNNPLGGNYSRVEVKTNSPEGYNGKVVYEYSNPADQPMFTAKMEWPFVASQRFASWAYGLPKNVTVYDKDNNLVKISKTDYKYFVEKLANPENLNCNCATQNKRSQQGFRWIDKQDTYFTWNQVHWMVPRPYYHYTGRTDIAATVEEEYRNGSPVFSSTTSVTTDPATLLQKGKTIRKEVNSLTLQTTYYPTDFNLPGAIEKLKLTNAIHTPVATETWKLTVVPNGVNQRFDHHLVDASVTEYKLYVFGGKQEVKPYKIYALKTNTPLHQSVIGLHNPNMLLRKPEYYQVTAEFIYDEQGNLVEKRSFDNTTSFINDYKSRYVTATVSNAGFNDIAYAGFEADGKGNWNYDQATVKFNRGLTGLNAFQLGENGATISRSNLNATTTYYVTWWAQNVPGNTALINGLPGELLVEANGWKLYRQEISGMSSVTLTGNALIDELRLYPKNTLMATTAYKNGVGKIAECDINNRITFYEYDGLNRIKLIRDQERNVIKTFEYNYKK